MSVTRDHIFQVPAFEVIWRRFWMKVPTLPDYAFLFVLWESPMSLTSSPLFRVAYLTPATIASLILSAIWFTDLTLTESEQVSDFWSALRLRCLWRSITLLRWFWLNWLNYWYLYLLLSIVFPLTVALSTGPRLEVLEWEPLPLPLQPPLLPPRPPPRNPPWSPAIIRDLDELSYFGRCVFTSIFAAMNET